MNLEQLRVFSTLADTLHFHRTAAICHMSPSAVSRCIQQMELHLNCRLFARDNRSVALTQEGQTALVLARETLQQWEALRDALQSQSRHLRGALSLYCSVTASYSFLYHILTDFRQRHPLIEIKIHTGDPALAVERVVAGHEDLAIAARQPVMPQTLEFKRITRSPLVMIQPLQSGAIAVPDDDRVESWQKVPFILSERGVARERLNQWFQERGITPNIHAQVAGHEAIVSMVGLGFGVGLVPQIVLDNSPLHNRVCPVARQPELAPYEVGFCVLARRLKSPLIKAFWDQIEEA